MDQGPGKMQRECNVDATTRSGEGLHVVDDPIEHAGVLACIDDDPHPWVRIWARLQAVIAAQQGQDPGPGEGKR